MLVLFCNVFRAFLSAGLRLCLTLIEVLISLNSEETILKNVSKCGPLC